MVQSKQNYNISKMMNHDIRKDNWAASSEKNAFEDAQHAQIQLILRKRKASFGPLLSIYSL